MSTEKHCALPSILHANGTDLLYSYDSNGNIISILEMEGTSEILKSYEYDELNQLIRENDKAQGKSFVYSYDQGGNLQSVKEYAFTETTLPETPVKTVTGTYDATWKDKLLTWDETAMTYDAIGNMLTKGNTTFSWQGRKLTGVENGKSIQYSYDHTGARTKKVVDGVTTEYRMAGDLLVSEKTGDQIYWYCYDSSANLVSMTVDKNIYFYVRNLQGDVIALVDHTGMTVVKYNYDSWGRILSITGSLADTIGVQNPFRYRGYYYDAETGMYYLKNRYYDPELRRFICADGIFTVQASLETLHNRNLYSYCDENPVFRSDQNGDLWMMAAASFAVGALVSIGCQMVIDGKHFNEINWVEAGVSGVTTAMTMMGAPGAAQFIVGTVGDAVSSIVEGENMEDAVRRAVFNNVVSEAVPFKVDSGYAKLTRRYHKKVSNIAERTLDPVKLTVKVAETTKTYKKQMNTTTIQGVLSYSGDYTVSKIPLRKHIGWGRRYNPKTGLKETYKIYKYI